MVVRMIWKDTEYIVVGDLVDALWKLREDPNAQLRVLKYVVDRLGLPVRIVTDKKFTAPLVERCEEIETGVYIG
jgi:hypothetical protein